MCMTEWVGNKTEVHRAQTDTERELILFITKKKKIVKLFY